MTEGSGETSEAPVQTEGRQPPVGDPKVKRLPPTQEPLTHKHSETLESGIHVTIRASTKEELERSKRALHGSGPSLHTDDRARD